MTSPSAKEAPELSDTDFATLITILIKDGRTKQAAQRIGKRMSMRDRNPFLYSLGGMLRATNGEFLKAVPSFLYAYAMTRNPFYRRQLEEILSKAYAEHTPCILDSIDFMSFHEAGGAKIEEITLSSITRQAPVLDGQPPEIFPSALFEEVLADRGLWIAESKNLEILYAREYHSVPITRSSFLLEKQHETLPSPTDLFPFTSTAAGTVGVYSVHMDTRSVLCRKSTLPVHEILEECVYIGGSPNVGHFLLDYLPKIEIWAQVKGDRDLPIYTYNLSGYCREMTEALYPEFKFMDLAAQLPALALLRFKCTHTPSYVPAGFSFPALHGRAKSFGYLTSENRAGDLIYLGRGKAYNRISNEEELTEHLQNLGFTVIDTMETSFKEIMAIMANARVVVGTCGASNAYLPFCSPGTEYIELLPETMAKDTSWHFNDRIFAHSHIRYRQLPCHTEFMGLIGARTEFRFRCNIEAIDKAVRKSAKAAGVVLGKDIPLAS